MQTPQHSTDQGGPRPQLEAEAWKRAGISRSHAYELMSAQPPAFPRPVKIGKASRFVSAEVDSWIANRIAERDALMLELTAANHGDAELAATSGAPTSGRAQ